MKRSPREYEVEALLHKLFRNSLHARQRASFPKQKALRALCILSGEIGGESTEA